MYFWSTKNSQNNMVYFFISVMTKDLASGTEPGLCSITGTNSYSSIWSDYMHICNLNSSHIEYWLNWYNMWTFLLDSVLLLLELIYYSKCDQIFQSVIIGKCHNSMWKRNISQHVLLPLMVDIYPLCNYQLSIVP